jgi:hypothetical protein
MKMLRKENQYAENSFNMVLVNIVVIKQGRQLNVFTKNSSTSPHMQSNCRAKAEIYSSVSASIRSAALIQ